MDLTSLQKIAAEHPYVLLALVLGFLVRLMKSDTKFPIDVPPAARKYVAALLAAFGVVIERLATGVPTKDAMVHGLVAWAVADFGHKLIVDDLRGGKELPVPFLMIPGASPSPGKPPSIPPPPKVPSIPPGIVSMIAAIAIFTCIGCAKFFKVLDLAADKSKCVVANQDLPNDVIFTKCALEEPERYLELLETSRAEAKRAATRALEKASLDRSDAGCFPVVDAGVPEAGK